MNVLLMQVLFLVDPIDEVAIQNLKSYKEKNFVDISKEDLDLGSETLILISFSIFRFILAVFGCFLFGDDCRYCCLP